MKRDSIKKFVNLRDSLLKERSEIERRLAQINEALGQSGSAYKAVDQASNAPRTRIRNAFSLIEAVQKVTASKGLTKKEILPALEKIGYRFTAKNPVNSLNTVLYRKDLFKNNEGKFSPVSS